MMWRSRGDGFNDGVLERGRERWSQESIEDIDFGHRINFCLAIDFSRLDVNLELSDVTPTG